ncbi:MAG: CDP-diacylglycerol--glycerol-3-phosphate 3-phosphatidyltransferase [Bacteroidota bacterium]
MNVPNLVTFLRLLLVPVFILFFEQGNLPVALGVFLVASLTDWVDGTLARKLNQCTALGAMLDPLVDKVLVTAALVGLSARGWVPAWTVTLILAREFLITGLRTAAADQGISIPASIWGKAKTFTQLAAIACFLYPLPTVAQPLYWLAVALTIYSGGEYLYRTRAIWRNEKH